MKNYLIMGAILLGLGGAAWASPNNAALDLAWAGANKAAQKGPTKAAVAGQAEVIVPAGYDFIPKMEAVALMKAMGNGRSPELYGMILPSNNKDQSMYLLEYKPEGYVKDDEAKDMKVDELLDSYKQGTEAANQERIAQGGQALEVIGWSQKPTYDEKLHRLTWAMIGRDKGASGGENDNVNYETRILGREGVVSITMIADLKDMAAGKIKADALTAGLTYVEGKKYENFSAGAGDKVAEYGLAALITGVAVKKLGLLAMAGVFIAKFAKIGLVLLFGVFPFLKRFFKKKEVASTDVTSTTSDINSPTRAESTAELKDTTKL